MENQFSQSECQWVLDKFLETHPAESVSMYQIAKTPEILVVETGSSCLTDMKKLEAMNISITIFAEGSMIQHYIMKLKKG